MTGRSYLVRHGQSEWNLQEITQGKTTWPRLTPLGRAQARAAAARIRSDLGHGAQVALVRSSDQVRARETAEILVALLGGRLELDPRLREHDLGYVEGRSYEVTREEMARHDWSDLDAPFAGGESPREVQDRIRAAIEEVDPRVVTVLVTHGDAMHAALVGLGAASTYPASGHIANGAVLRMAGAELSWVSAAD